MFVWLCLSKELVSGGRSLLSPFCRFKVKHGQRDNNGLSYADQQFSLGVLKSQYYCLKQELVKSFDKVMQLPDMGPLIEITTGVYCV